MLSEYDDPGIGLGAFLLSLNTMLMLEKKGLLTHEETKEIVEQALLNLETHELRTTPKSQEVSKAARVIFEGLRQLISRPSASR